MALEKSFSQRNQLREPRPISIREAAPDALRYFILQTAVDLEWTPSMLRPVVCRVLRTAPNAYNWSDYPNVWEETLGLVNECRWYEVYDIIEAIYAAMVRDSSRLIEDGKAAEFAAALNSFFIEEGIAWQLEDGRIMTRGPETFEAVVRQATAELNASERPTAAKHLHEALQDLSRRPEADLPGAVYHAMGSLECVARDLTGDEKATLGEILKRYTGLVPKPLDSALSQVWGYASNEARHVREGRETNREEAELLVGLSAALVGYLTRKQS